MVRLGDIIEPVGQLTVFGQRANPLPVLVHQAPKLPLRQFKREQRKRRVDPGFIFDEPLDPLR